MDGQLHSPSIRNLAGTNSPVPLNLPKVLKGMQRLNQTIIFKFHCQYKFNLYLSNPRRLGQIKNILLVMYIMKNRRLFQVRNVDSKQNKLSNTGGKKIYSYLFILIVLSLTTLVYSASLHYSMLICIPTLGEQSPITTRLAIMYR